MSNPGTGLRLHSHQEVRDKARQIRRAIIDIVYTAQSGHPGGALGMADIFTTLYYRFLQDRPAEPGWADRDRFILSNGHICPVLYAILADRGYFDRAALKTFRRLGSALQGHPSLPKGLPGVEYSGGSLGNGLSFALGTALAARLQNRPYRVFCGISDGENQEGQIWEAAMAAAHFKVGNLIVMIDQNGCQIDGRLENIMEVRPLAPKWEAFGWHVQEVDGHDLAAVHDALTRAVETTDRPSVLIGETILGKGVSYMEDDYHWHHGAPTEEEYRRAMAELADPAP
ncbi:MAG: transketolase [Thermaerobacterales bacterium]